MCTNTDAGARHELPLTKSTPIPLIIVPSRKHGPHRLEPFNNQQCRSVHSLCGLDNMSTDLRPNTVFLLMAQYSGAAVVPLDSVCRDYFRHLTTEKLLRNILAGAIPLPIIRIEKSQKAARGVHRVDLGAYIDKQRELALKECRQLSGVV
jgi:Pyocin activator protein PrtN